MKEDTLYTAEEISKKLKLTKGTVYEMIKRGELEAHRVGRHIRISQTQFDNYLLKSRGWENVYDATISEENDETFANVQSIKMHVNTDLEGQVKISIPPENIILSKSEFVSSARNIFKGKVTDIIDTTPRVLVSVDIGVPIRVLITAKSLEEMAIQKGTEIYVVFKTMSVTVYK